MKHVFKIVLIILISVTIISFSNASSLENFTLNCKMSQYSPGTSTTGHYSINQLKKIIPENYVLHLTPNGGFFKNNKIRITKKSEDKLYFEYIGQKYNSKSIWSSNSKGTLWKHIYFKKTKKLNVSIPRNRHSFDIWGNCTVEKLNKDILVASKDLENTKVKSVLKLKRNETKETTRRLAEASAKKEAKEERQKRLELEKKLAILEKKQKEQQVKSKTLVAKEPKSEFPLKPFPIKFPSVSIKRDDIAVIIGNANYKKMGKDIPNVNPAYADAEGIKKYFMKAKGIREGNIIYLKDATGAQLLGIFGNDKSYKGKLFNYIKPNKSNVYIYYAGHGAPGEEGDAYLVPTDTDSQTIEFTGFPLSTLYSNLGKLPAKSLTVILEACFSGGSQSGSLISRASPIIIQPKKTMIPENIKVIAAGSERQMASWEEDSSHSLFTKYFLKAMSGEGDSNKDGKVSDAELKEYLSDTMTYYARRYYGRDQKVQIHNGG